MDSLPNITIIIPHKDYQEYLSDAIDSALNQDYPNFQICVVDDGSEDKDSFKEIVNNHLFLSHDVEWLKAQNDCVTAEFSGNCAIILPSSKGPSHARNLGIRHTWSSTDIYANLDADDIMHSNKLTECMKPFLQWPANTGVVYADYNIYNTTTGVTVPKLSEPYSQERLSQDCIVHSGALMSKQALKAVEDEFGFYDEQMRTAEDYDLWIRMSERFMIHHVPKILTTVRIQPQNSTSTVDKEIWMKNWQRIRQKIVQRNS